jgi:tetratricopeptide (TPR) repeat protein
MRFTYDNSANNVHNPNNPPRRVLFGPETSDEMGEVWLQVLPSSPRDMQLLVRDYAKKQAVKAVAVNRERLRLDPSNVRAHLELGKGLWHQGIVVEAQSHFETAASLDPESEDAHYFLGLCYRVQKQFPRAAAEFEAALRLNPDSFKAHGNLGLMFMEQGDLTRAEEHLVAALQLNPDDALARQSLKALRQSKPGKRP